MGFENLGFSLVFSFRLTCKNLCALPIKPRLHAPFSSSKVLFELLGQENRTRRTTRRTTRPMFSSDILMGVFWLTGNKPRPRKFDAHFLRFPKTRFLNLVKLGDVGHHLRGGNLGRSNGKPPVSCKSRQTALKLTTA